MMLASTNDDETNIITSAIARRNNCKSLILINNSEYSNLKKEVLGIDRIIDPRMITASQILKHVHKGKIESVYSISNNQGEIHLHAQALKNSKLINVPLKDLSIPDGIRIE